MPNRFLCLALLIGGLAAKAQIVPPIHIVNPGNLVNCTAGQSLERALAGLAPGAVLYVEGKCVGPFTIRTSGVSLIGWGSATLSATAGDTITINGAQAVTLQALTVSGANNGVVVQNNAQVTMRADHAGSNLRSGVFATGNSSVTIIDSDANSNGSDGVELDSTSSLVMVGSVTMKSNTAFGIDVRNGSSLRLHNATVNLTGNGTGIRLEGNASASLDSSSSLAPDGNTGQGLIVCAGSHLFSTGGTIQASFNGSHGIWLRANAGIVVDAGAEITADANSGDGLRVEQNSDVAVFNDSSATGVSAASIVEASSNSLSGLEALAGSSVSTATNANLQLNNNQQAGLLTDQSEVDLNGTSSSNLTLNSTDLLATFGSKLTVAAGTSVNVFNCDATVLARGGLGITCPH